MAKNFQSITYYQTMLVVLIMVVLGGISFSYIAAKEYERLVTNFGEAIDQILASVENSASNAVYTYNDNLAREIAEGLFRFDAIYAMSLADEDGSVLASFKKEKISEPRNGIYQMISGYLGVDKVSKTVQLYYKDTSDVMIEMGTLKVVASKQHAFNVFLDGFFNLIISAFFVISSLTIMLIVLFQRLIARPLVQVADAFSHFDIEHPERSVLPDPEDYPNNEFRVVIENGNKMLATIHENLTKIRQSRDLLEQRVEERTTDLQKLTQAIEQSPTMMFITNKAGRIEYANKRYYVFTGFEKSEVIDQIPRMLSGGSTPHEVYKDLWRSIHQGKVWKHEIEDRRKDGTSYWADITVAPIKDQAGEITHYLCAQEDITQRIVALKELTDARDEAEKANRSKSEFLSNMSHELRTPLNAILGFAQLMDSSKKNPLTEKQSKQIGQILKGGNHLLELINEVLELSRIEAGKLGLSIETVNAEEVIQDCLGFASTIAQSKGIEIKDCTNLPKPNIYVDRLRTKQVLMNLLSNAIKYNREGGSVWVYGENVEDNMFRISVVDTGFGISEQKQDGLFEPFNRLGAETTGIEGTGIGLALSQKLVKMMDGNIGFSSVENKSSTFWCEFPICSTECTEDEPILASEESAQLKNGHAKTLLYVEDNPANLALFQDVIDDLSNVNMISTHTAELGIVLAQEESPDVIILDINLPGMSGIEAMGQLRQNPVTCDIPVIALSANAMPSTIDQAMAAGFSDYLTKPLKIDKLFKVLEQYLESDVRH